MMRKSRYPNAARAVPGLAGARFFVVWLAVSVIGVDSTLLLTAGFWRVGPRTRVRMWQEWQRANRYTDNSDVFNDKRR
jgi:hypothetical protein